MADKLYSVTSTMADSWQVTGKIGNHKVVIDQPSATDTGPNPLDSFLFSLAGCISTIAKMAARDQGFKLRAIQVTVNATLNPAGLAGKPTDDPVGFKRFDIQANIDADLSDEEKLAFLDLVCARCPVHDNICRTSIAEHSLC